MLAAIRLLPARSLPPVGILLAVLGGAAALLPTPGSVRARRRAVLLCLGAAVGMLWTWRYDRAYLAPARALDGVTGTMEAVVLDWPEETEYGARVDVRAALPGGERVKARIYGDGTYRSLLPGDRIRLTARCAFAGWDRTGEETSYLTAKGILLTASARSAPVIERPERMPASCIPAVLAHRLKQGLAAALPEEDAPLATAVITGDRSGLGLPLTSDMRRVGLAHAVAVSGMHMAFLVALLELLLGKGRVRTALVCVPVTGLFALMTGWTPSVVRAAVMIDLFLFAPLLDRERDDATTLGAALLVLLVPNPYAAADVGLQLSFASVGGILLFSQRLRHGMNALLRLEPDAEGPLRRRINRLLYGLTASLGVTFGALVFTVPLGALYFGSVSLVAPLSNLAALWAVSLVFSFGLPAGIVGAFLPQAGAVLAAPAALAVRFLRRIIPLLARIPFAAVPTSNGFFAVWLLLLYGLLAWVLFGRSRRRVWAIPAAAVTLCAALLLTIVSLRTGEVTVRALDVGQGQSVLIRSESSFLLCDCGGDGYHEAGGIAAEGLEQMGSRTLDLLILSHFDSDHVNGVCSLLERVNVKCIALPDVEAETRDVIEQCAASRGTEIRPIRERTRIRLNDGAQIVLLPPLGAEDDSNEMGLTALFSCGGFDVLITGDMGQRTERVLLRTEPMPDVELMIAGHHGSQYSNSEELLRAVTPDEVIVSVGAGNPYGHPAPETLARFAAVGAKVYRTDEQGTVTVQASPHR